MASYTREQRDEAVALFEELGSVTAVIRSLGYPTRQQLYKWVNGDDAAHNRTAGPRFQHYDPEVRALAIKMFDDTGDAGAVARLLGVSNAAIVYNWVRKRDRDRDCGDRMESGKPSRPATGGAHAYDGFEGDLAEKVRQLELENDILRGAVDVLKAEGLNEMTNVEKTRLIDKLRLETGRPLKELTGFLRISKSSYEYCRKAMSAADKYAGVREQIVEIFDGANGRRGYRYVHHELMERGVGVSEKVVRRLMAEEGCRVAYVKKAKRYSSYGGEISDAPENLVKRDFHADAPNKLWLTDITEFGLPCGKCYLSPVLDCFDGKVVSWSIGTSPNAELANSSLLRAVAQLKEGEKPTCHSDRGVHYRWPGWISICERAGITRSMSRKGCSPDNSACEGLFGRLKNEFFYFRSWQGVTMEEFMTMLNDYLEFYNDGRIKQSLGWMSPNQYRRSKGLAA